MRNATVTAFEADSGKSGAPAGKDIAPSPNGKAGEKTLDLEIKDAQLIFESIWRDLEQKHGRNHLRFPKEIFWLNGSPGGGKATQTRSIMEFRDLTAPPIVLSDLLVSLEANRLKDAGMMVGDREVTRLLFDRLLDPENETGAIVDGYPRTQVQVECLKLLYQKIMELRRETLDTPLEEQFPKPNFHIIVLFIDEAVSVGRQFDRGKEFLAHNEHVARSGVGDVFELRKTDLTEQAARNRYRTFKEITYSALRSLREVFHYHFVNAEGTIEEVKDRIVEELSYQSSLELDQATYDRLTTIPIASQLVVHARQQLVKRLDDYERNHPELFKRVVEIIGKKFIPIITRHAISGMAYINSEDETFSDPMALAMMIDVFSERGYHTVVDLRRYAAPHRVDPETFKIHTIEKRVYRFRISFHGSEIRRGR